ncbi:MAG: class D beta-lactamase [Flavobacteriales bacterium]|nr:class D beta-lactamase [Bacteroidota bacterium]MCB9240886.1 class D beta-lactamase [Flavobacteriales bacterium]
MTIQRFLCFLPILIWSCSSSNTSTQPDQSTPETHEQPEPTQVVSAEFDSILKAADVKGTILVFDPAQHRYLSNRYTDWTERSLPASTFKITNSIIGLETGVIKGIHHPFKWDGQPRRLKIWERDFDLESAFKASCVDCYQEVAAQVGTSRMQQMLDTLHYGSMLVSDSTLTTFWLEGESGISPLEQINFLERLHNKELPISDSTWSILRTIMLLDDGDSTRIYGKTGWAIRNGMNTGWFVGWAERNDRVYYFATRIQPDEDFNMALFPKIRYEITENALNVLWESKQY